MKSITIKLEDDFHKELKRFSVEHEISIQELTVQALKQYMENKK